MEKKSTSWFWIIFWIIFWLTIFWPIGLLLLIRGLFLLIKNMVTDKSAMMSRKTGVILFFMRIIGWILIIVGAMGAWTFIDSLSRINPGGYDSGRVISIIVLILAMIVGGVLLLIEDSRTRKIVAKYKKYIDIVVNQNTRSIDNIASAMRLSYDTALNDLRDMINLGYLKDTYIDQDRREIFWRQQENSNRIPNSDIQTKAVRCPGCGASNVIPVGRVSECSYCGTPINA